MNVKTDDLLSMSDEIDDIFHKYGFVVDRHVLSSHIMNIIKSSYPNDRVELKYQIKESYNINDEHLTKRDFET